MVLLPCALLSLGSAHINSWSPHKSHCEMLVLGGGSFTDEEDEAQRGKGMVLPSWEKAGLDSGPTALKLQSHSVKATGAMDDLGCMG